MQPRTHALVIRRAHERAAGAKLEPRRDPPSRSLERLLGALLAGNDDEDTYAWPLVGWRTPAIGFTHTFRPGHRHGELLLPSAKTRCVALFERARATKDARSAAHLLGRACHLLTDAAVPARTQGVWHYFGDPLESWIEQHVDLAATLADAPVPAERSPGELMERLAARSVVHAVDTTKSLPGLVAIALGRGRRLAGDEVEAQARALFPEAVAHVTALLAAFEAAP